MTLKLMANGKLQWYVNGPIHNKYLVAGLHPSFQKYEKEIFSGKRKCPFKVQYHNADGILVANGPIPLTPAGKPKMELFG